MIRGDTLMLRVAATAVGRAAIATMQKAKAVIQSGVTPADTACSCAAWATGFATSVSGSQRSHRPPSIDRDERARFACISPPGPRLANSVSRRPRRLARVAPGALLLICSAFGAAYAQTPDEQTLSIEERLIEVGENQAVALRAIHETPNLVTSEIDRVMTELDGFFSTDGRELMDAHHDAVEKELQRVEISDHIGNLGVTWRQWLALLDDRALVRLVEQFAAAMQSLARPLNERTIAEIDERLDDLISSELQRSLNAIRRPYREVLDRHFGDDDLLDTYESLSPLAPLPEHLSSEGLSEAPVGFGLAILTSLTSIAVRKVVKVSINRVVGRAAGAVVPVVSAALIAIDVIGMFNAKDDMDADLRARFMEEYARIMSIDAIWRQDGGEDASSVRADVQDLVRVHLQTWRDRAVDDAERLIEAAHVFALSPTVGDYISRQTSKGRDREQIFESLRLVSEVYGPDLIAATPIDTLLTMILHAPDRRDLSRLAGALDMRLVDEYLRHGRAFLVAADRLGVPVFIDILRNDSGIVWNDAVALFEYYPRDMAEMPRRGLALALREHVGAPGIPLATLENIARRNALFRTVAPIVAPDRDKLYRLFRNREILDVVDRSFADNPDASESFVGVWSARTWEGYRDTARYRALMAVAGYRLSEQRQIGSEFAREIEQSDVPLDYYLDAGIDGVRLWDAHAGPATGSHQGEQAEAALGLLKKGYPLDELLVPEDLAWLLKYDRSSGIARMWYAVERRLYSLGTVVFYVLAAIAVAIGGIFVWGKWSERNRSSRGGGREGAGDSGSVKQLMRYFVQRRKRREREAG